MELLVILLSGLMALVSPVGVVTDRVAENAIRKQLAGAETLEVRIDNAPFYRLLQGKVDRIRIAGRGVFPLKGVRLDVLEVETGALQLDAQRLVKRGRTLLEQPLQMGIRVVIKQQDLAQALQSQTVLDRLRKAGFSILSDRESKRDQRYQLINPRIDFLDNQRLRLQVQVLEKGDPATLDIFAESGIEIVAGRQIRLVDPILRLNGEPAPENLLKSITDGISERSDLQRLEKSGHIARILQLKINSKQLELAAFVQIPPATNSRKNAFLSPSFLPSNP